MRVHDPVTDKFLSSVEVDLVSNSSFLDVELPVDSFCNDRVEAYSLQATQAVRAGSLVAGRRTVVRLYANPVRSSQGVLANIPARLRGFRNGAELPESPLDPVMVAINVDPSDTHRMRESNQSKSWNFILPDSWTDQGTTRLIGEVDYNNTLGEDPATFDNNQIEEGVNFTRAAHLTIQPMSIWEFRGGVWQEPNLFEMLTGLL